MITLKQADDGYSISATLKRDGVVYNLTGCTSVKLRARCGGVATEIACDIDPTPTTGKVSATLQETMAAGIYEAEFRVTTDAAKELTFPNSGYETFKLDPRI
jgi:hypothetical protein